jgi:hypothetical protein
MNARLFDLIWDAVGVFAIVFGLLLIFAKGWLWRFGPIRNAFSEHQEERDEHWNKSTTAGGVIIILISIAWIIFF